MFKFIKQIKETIKLVEELKQNFDTTDTVVKEHEELLGKHDLDEFVTQSSFDDALDDKLDKNEYDFDDFITRSDAERVARDEIDDTDLECRIEDLEEEIKKLKPVEKKKFILIGTPKPLELEIDAVSKEEAIELAEKKLNANKNGLSYTAKLA